jgi:hypothetical protein
MHGKGLYVLPDNTIIYCISNENEITGWGRILYENGDYYEG